MTKAVCFNCGELKHGAFTSCKACHIRPAGEAEMVRSLGLSDHYLTQEQIDQVAKLIKNGEPIQFQEEQLELLTQEVKKFLLTPVGKMLSGQTEEPSKNKWWQFWKS